MDSVRGDIDHPEFQSVVRTITGFAELDSVGVDTDFIGLGIQTNTSLTSIPPFDALKGTAGSINILDNAALTTLPAFAALTSIVVDLHIADNDKLANFSGFANLATVGGDLNIGSPEITGFSGSTTPAVGNPLLTGLPTFPALTRIRGSLNVVLNIALTGLSGFDALTTLGEDLYIEGNDKLATVSGFITLPTIGTDFSVVDNDVLTSISGFDALRTITGDLNIGVRGTPNVGNPDLTGLTAFDPLTTITGSLNVVANGALTDLSTFTSLTTLGADLYIDGNALLATLSGFGAITSIVGDLTISGNEKLVTCCNLLSVVDLVTTGGGTNTISGNAAGCEGVSETRTACASVPAPTEVVHTGDLTIAAPGDVPGNVTEVERITGNLSVSGTITSFPDFAALKVVQGNLTIENITGAGLTIDKIFPVLDTIRGNLTIQNQAVVQTIAGFAELDSVGADGSNTGISINNNTSLTSIPTFNVLKGVGGSINITVNGQFATISGFDALVRVGGSITISFNPLLTTISTFNVLESVTSIRIRGNIALTAISGFGSLTTITRNLIVENNTQLSSCCGLFSIANNSLTPGTLTNFSGNATGCNEKAEITSTCSASLTIDDPADVTAALATLTRITGDLTIGGTITTFPDFAALRVVEGNLTISGLTALTDNNLANIFSVLEEVQGDLLIQNNADLLTIAGFVALREVGGNVSIGGATSGDGNAALTDAPALDALTTIGGNLVIAGNGSLTTAPTLTGLVTLTGKVTIQDNGATGFVLRFLSPCQ